MPLINNLAVSSQLLLLFNIFCIFFTTFFFSFPRYLNTDWMLSVTSSLSQAEL